MITIYLAMYKNKKVFTDNLITFISRGNYSHCEIIVKDTKSKMYSASVRDGNKVRCKSTDGVDFNKDNWDIFEFNVNQSDLNSFITYFEYVKGTKYGFKTLIFNHLIRLPFKFKDEMICSDFCTVAMYNLFKSRLTPTQKIKLLTDTHLVTPSNMLSRFCEAGIFGHLINNDCLQLK